MRKKNNDNLLLGILIGATVPVLGYWCIETLFTLLTESGIMDEVSISTSVKRQKTLTLLAICALSLIHI